jgi:hypothetical protein
VDVFLIRDATDDLLAEVHLEDRTDAEFDANARLIAAAPELLNALNALLAYVETIPFATATPGGTRCLTMARAACAKAEGETS